jgi:hypothetical protein
LPRTVSRLSQAELQAALARLVASELVFQRGTPPDAVYSFKHLLVQDSRFTLAAAFTRLAEQDRLGAIFSVHSSPE